MFQARQLSSVHYATPTILDFSRRCPLFSNVELSPQFDTVGKYQSVLKLAVKILNRPVSMHEQQESVSGEVSHCLF